MKADYGIEWHFEHIPRIMRPLIKFLFKKNLDGAIDVFNGEIDWANKMWDYFGTGSCLDKGYTRYIAKAIKPRMDTFNYTIISICKYKIDPKNANIVGYCPFIPGSKIWYKFQSDVEDTTRK